jgi:hypothetical protein
VAAAQVALLVTCPSRLEAAVPQLEASTWLLVMRPVPSARVEVSPSVVEMDWLAAM